MNCADFARSAIARRIFDGDGLVVVMQMRSMPAAMSASASLTFDVQMPRAPAASCFLAMSALLCVLACGRAPSPFAASRACIVVMFDSSASRSTQRAGVSRSHFETPIVSSIARISAAE